MPHTATASIEIAATPDRVWETLTSPDAIRQFMFGAEASGDWTVGATVTFRGNWNGTPYEDKGRITTADRPRHLAFDFWSAFSGQPDTPENRQPVAYTLEPTATGTKLTVTQGNNATTEAAMQAEGNWQQTLETLRTLLT